MIRFCHACGRGFLDAKPERPCCKPPLLCAMCRRPGGKPLSRLLDGDTREVAERKQVEKERRRVKEGLTS